MSEGLHGDDIEVIADLAAAKVAAENAVLEIHDEAWTRDAKNGELRRVDKPDYEPGPLDLDTLQGIVDYVRDNPDGDKVRAGGKRFLHIVGPTEVLYYVGAAGPYLRRTVLARATAIVPAFEWGRQMTVEGFLNFLRTFCAQTPGVIALIDVFSHIDATQSIKLTDDGLSHEIVRTAGVRSASAVRLPNPLLLQPHRTFSEVIQPETPFLIRLQGGGNGALPTVTLTEADMGQWRLAAIANIKAKLVDSLPGVSVYG